MTWLIVAFIYSAIGLAVAQFGVKLLDEDGALDDYPGLAMFFAFVMIIIAWPMIVLQALGSTIKARRSK